MTLSAMAAPAAAIGRVAATALDWLLPPQCLSCRAPVDRQGQVCAECWRGLSFIDEPMCTACGLPFDFEVGEDALCGACAGALPLYSRARSVMRYNDSSRRLILAFKHADRTAAAPSKIAWQRAAASSMEHTAPVTPIVPPIVVPTWAMIASAPA